MKVYAGTILALQMLQRAEPELCTTVVEITVATIISLPHLI